MVDFKLWFPEEPSLAAQVRACAACSARQEAAEPVPGIGFKTGIVFFGKNPGKHEDIQGKPFQGPSGKILDVFLHWCGLTRKDIFLDNLIRCHTLDDRDPTLDEVRACVKLHLLNYVEALQPYLVVTMGGPASLYLAGVKKISQDHGKIIWNTRGFWTIPVFHPGSVLHKPQYRDELVFDATQIKRFLEDREVWKARRLERITNASSSNASAQPPADPAP